MPGPRDVSSEASDAELLVIDVTDYVAESKARKSGCNIGQAANVKTVEQATNGTNRLQALPFNFVCPVFA